MKTTLLWGSAFGILSIILGALGAHALKSVLTETQLSSFETGVKYQMYHALFLLLLGVLQHNGSIAGLKAVRNLTIAGVFGFSFSIYALNMQTAWGVKLSFLGPITPVGGLLLISAWVVLFFNIARAANR